MSVHTPGPWSVWTTGEQLMVTADAKHYPEIAYVGPDTNASENGFSDEEEANARLIAGAPELLEAAKQIWDWIAAAFGLSGVHVGRIVHRVAWRHVA